MTGLLSPSHIAILLVVVLVVFGAKRLPELGRSLGSGMREFKDSVNHDPEDAAALTSARSDDAGDQVHDTPVSDVPPQPAVLSPTAMASADRPDRAER